MKNIKLKMGVASVLITAVVIACVIVLNVIVGIVMRKHPVKIDLTQDKIYEFSAQTKDVMKNLDSEVKAYAIIPETTQGENIDYIKAYLEKYEALSDNFSVEFIDPYENPTFMNKYSGETQPDLGSVIIECEDKYEVVLYNQLYKESSFAGEYQVDIDMEKQVTNAIMRVTDKLSAANIYFTTTHKENSYTGGSVNLKALLEKEGYTCKDLAAGEKEIPADANIVISTVPQEDFTAEERDALAKFLDKGGRFILVADPAVMKPMERMDTYLKEWGIKLNYDLVIETDEKNSVASGAGVSTIPLVKLNEHMITEKLMESGTMYPVQQSMSITAQKSTNGSVVTKLLTTSEKSYGKTNLNTSNIEKEEGDLSGPLCVAAIAERASDDVKSAIMVIGSFFATEDPNLLNEGAYLNSDFILNTFSYMSGVKASADIRAKQVTPEVMTMTEEQVKMTSIVIQFILPGVIVLLGLIIWLRRRFK